MPSSIAPPESMHEEWNKKVEEKKEWFKRSVREETIIYVVFVPISSFVHSLLQEKSERREGEERRMRTGQASMLGAERKKTKLHKELR